MIETAKKIFALLDTKEKNKALIFIFLLIIATILEGLSVAMIFPLMNFIIEGPEIKFFNNFFAIFKIENFDRDKIIIFSIILIAFMYSLKSAYLIFFSWWKSNFIHKLNTNISNKLFMKYLHSPLSFFYYKNSAQFIRNIFTETRLLNLCTDAFLKLKVELLAILIIIFVCFIIEPRATSIIFIIFGLFGIIFNKYFSKKIKNWGYSKQQYTGKIFQNLQQGFGSIKDILLRGNQEYFQSKFNENIVGVNNRSRSLMFVGEIPKNALETIAVFLICFLILISINDLKDINSIIPVVGVFGAAALRIVPGVNRLISIKQNIDSATPSVNLLFNELKLPKEEKNSVIEKNYNKEKIIFNNQIDIKKISFKYPNSKENVIKNLSFTIKKNDCICFVGGSGIGKTTFIDIISGLITPQSGEILADGKNIFKNIENWKKLIGYIPQSIYLTDDTIKENILFGVEEKNIDQTNLSNAINHSQLNNLIKDLPEGLEYRVGEKGSSLSGGQIQRIGIARSLYTNPQILICDEITSSLDRKTSENLMNCLNSLVGKITIIFISHSNSVIKNANKIYSFEKGSNQETLLVEQNKNTF